MKCSLLTLILTIDVMIVHYQIIKFANEEKYLGMTLDIDMDFIGKYKWRNASNSVQSNSEVLVST